MLPLQNGVDTADELVAVVGPGRVLAGTTYIAATLVEPGVVDYIGTVRSIVFGEAFGDRVVTDARVAAPRDAGRGRHPGRGRRRQPDRDLGEVHLPGANCRADGGGAPADRARRGRSRPSGRRSTPRWPRSRRWRAHAGVPVAADIRAQKLRYLDASPPTMRSSMMVDITSGRPLELEALVGDVVRRGRDGGNPTPVMATLYGILKPFERGAPGKA